MANISADDTTGIDAFLEGIARLPGEYFRGRLFPMAEELYQAYQTPIESVTVMVPKRGGPIWMKLSDYVSSDVLEEFDIGEYAGPRTIARAVQKQRALDSNASKKEEIKVIETPQVQKVKPPVFTAKTRSDKGRVEARA